MILSEYVCKKLYDTDSTCIAHINKNENIQDVKLVSAPLVCKIDEETKHRMLAGLVKLDISHEECTEFINNAVQTNFIVESFYKLKEEHYFMMEFFDSYDRIYFCKEGGIHFTDISKAKYIDIDIDQTTLSDEEYEKLGMNKSSYEGFINKILNMYRRCHINYMEINPVGITDKDIAIPIDFAVKFDPCSLYLWNECDKQILDENFVSKQDLSQEEINIQSLDEKTGASLKFQILNKNADIWTLISGGGASVLFLDALFNMGLRERVGNYGEYSGNPNRTDVFHYSSNVFESLLKSQTTKDITLLIGGGISNFTYVDKTFMGVIDAIEEYRDKLLGKNVKILVRRGGINYKEGLKMFKEKVSKMGFQVECFGPEKHITNFLTEYFTKDEAQLVSENVLDTVNKTDTFDQIITPYEGFYPTSSSKILVYNYQTDVVQRILDYDFFIGKESPSIVGIVSRERSNTICTVYWGKTEIFIPVYGSIESCPDERVDTVLNYMSFRSGYDSTKESLLDKRIRCVVLVAEGIAESEARELKKLSRSLGKTVLGPATVGSIIVGDLRMGNTCGSLSNISDQGLTQSGSVSLVTRSGGLLNEMCNIITTHADGVREAVSIGGDRYPCSTFLEHVIRFQNDPKTKLICLLGEVGGSYELEVAQMIKNKTITKPVVSWIMGTSAEFLMDSIQFGHAGSCANSPTESASYKNHILKSSGAIVPNTFEEIEECIKDLSMKLNLVIPETRHELSLPERTKHDFFSSISNETGDELEYNKNKITDIMSGNNSIGVALGHLLFKKPLPNYLCNFLEKTIALLADHGIAVSSAHNTAVCARGGQNVSACVASGLLCIHDKHGGAVHDAARYFYSGKYEQKISPNEFVKYMKSNNITIPGIGHAYKNSTTNRDKRIEILINIIRSTFPNCDLLEFALEVEQITLEKKNNLILNVDGVVATAIISGLLHEYGSDYVKEVLELESLNSLFIISRTIGLCSTFTDQKRLKQKLFRYPLDKIQYI